MLAVENIDQTGFFNENDGAIVGNLNGRQLLQRRKSQKDTLVNSRVSEVR
ncbi:MAG: hypothetical protein ACUZ8A_02625 [Candidatus Bathyanammoxibius sp.]